MKELNIILHYKMINLWCFHPREFIAKNVGNGCIRKCFTIKMTSFIFSISLSMQNDRERNILLSIRNPERYWDRKLFQSHGFDVWQGSSSVPGVDEPFGARLSIQTQAAPFPVYACAVLHILTCLPSAAGFSALPRRFLP